MSDIPFGVPPSDEVRMEALRRDGDPLAPAKGCWTGALLGTMILMGLGVLLWVILK